MSCSSDRKLERGDGSGGRGPGEGECSWGEGGGCDTCDEASTEVTGGERGAGVIGLIHWSFKWLRGINVDDVGPKISPTTGPPGLIKSGASEGSLGLVVAVMVLLHPGREDELPRSSSTAVLSKDCLASFAFDNFLQVLDPTVVFADLPIKNFCDTRRLRPRTDLVRTSFVEPENGEGRREFMFGEDTGLKARGVSGNVWLHPERADSGEYVPEVSRDPVSTEILPDDLG